MYTGYGAPPEHRIRCSIILLKTGSHGCRRWIFRGTIIEDPTTAGARSVFSSISIHDHALARRLSTVFSGQIQLLAAAATASPTTGMTTSYRQPTNVVHPSPVRLQPPRSVAASTITSRPAQRRLSNVLTPTSSVLADSVEIQQPSSPTARRSIQTPDPPSVRLASSSARVSGQAAHDHHVG
ncbi:hypothetical protein ACLOJK_010402 [Asimina triloba]